MNRILKLVGLVAGLAVLPSTPVIAGTAQAELSNDSIRMGPGDCSCGFGLVWTMYFSSTYTEIPAQANGEIAPLPQPAAYSHRSYLVLEDPSTVASAMPAEFDVPLNLDANHNGTPDFFEASQEVSVGSTGTYPVIWPPYSGQLTFQWTRAAGSRHGTCLLYMNDPVLGQMGPYQHTFELLSYTGELAYNRGSNSVSGTIRLTKFGEPTELLEGPVSLARSWAQQPTNRFNVLTLSGGDWTNQADVFSFGDGQLARDLAHPAVYRTALQNGGGAYSSWRLSITDTNDANGNGIPDLSDDLTTLPPRRPVLSLSRTSAQLLLSISGDIGRSHIIQEAAFANATNWSTIQSLNLTNDPHVLTLPLPNSSPTFWRVQAQ